MKEAELEIAGSVLPDQHGKSAGPDEERGVQDCAQIVRPLPPASGLSQLRQVFDKCSWAVIGPRAMLGQ
ncbi:hypothetical protein ACIRVK_18990 [Streptomyces sp. NPDC101152]|uniref:hypothetical protein n=1 Tax=Streptomyces sp. NPDC101152 TaxID=3366116 RepID=UPI00381786F9